MRAHGCSQQDGKHYGSSLIYVPVTNDMMICIMLILMLIYDWKIWVIDVKDAFLYGQLQYGEKIYMKVCKGLEIFYSGDKLLLLGGTLNGLK